jgi:hypothetical protein
MQFFRRRAKFRSVAAMLAAYAVVLHAFFGGMVLSQNAAAATSPFVICQGSGAEKTNHDNGQAPVKHISCILLCASHAAGTVPQPLPEVAAEAAKGAALPLIAADGVTRAHERTPRLAQAPPSNV